MQIRKKWMRIHKEWMRIRNKWMRIRIQTELWYRSGSKQKWYGSKQKKYYGSRSANKKIKNKNTVPCGLGPCFQTIINLGTKTDIGNTKATNVPTCTVSIKMKILTSFRLLSAIWRAGWNGDGVSGPRQRFQLGHWHPQGWSGPRPHLTHRWRHRQRSRRPPAPATQAAGMFHLQRCWHWHQKSKNCMGRHPERDYMAVSQVFTSE